MVNLIVATEATVFELVEHVVVKVEHLSRGDDGELAFVGRAHAGGATDKEGDTEFFFYLAQDTADVLIGGEEGIGGFAQGAVLVDGQ